MLVSMPGPGLFDIDSVTSAGVPVVVGLADRVAQLAAQRLYLLCSGLASHVVADEGAELPLAQVPSAGRARSGGGVLVLGPGSATRIAAVMIAHWRQGDVRWALVADARDGAGFVDEVRQDVSRAAARADFEQALVAGVGPQRALCVLCYDASFCLGRCATAVWPQVRPLLEGLGGES
jgi:hypothetical protein